MCPSNPTLTMVRSGTISLSCYTCWITDGFSTIVFFVLPTRQTQDMPLLVTNVVIVGLSKLSSINRDFSKYKLDYLDVFSNARHFIPCVGGCEHLPAL